VVSGEIGVVVRQSLFLCPNPPRVPTPTHIVWQRITYAKQYAGWEDAVVKNNLKKIIN
jgi:hypothetical protein